MKTKLLLLFILILYGTGLAQEYKWHLKLENGDILPNFALGQLVEDSLQIYPRTIKTYNGIESVKIPLVSVVEIKEEKKSKTGTWMLVGLIIGTGIGMAIGAKEDEGHSSSSSLDFGSDWGKTVGGVIGGLTGVGIGAVCSGIYGKDKVHDLREYTVQEKKAYFMKNLEIKKIGKISDG